MPDPMEEIIGNALLNRSDPDAVDRQMDCNMVARHRITCECGDVLDQSTVTVVKDGNMNLGGYCPKCAAKNRPKVAGANAQLRAAGRDDVFRYVTWDNDITPMPEDSTDDS